MGNSMNNTRPSSNNIILEPGQTAIIEPNNNNNNHHHNIINKSKSGMTTMSSFSETFIKPSTQYIQQTISIIKNDLTFSRFSM